MLRKFLDGLAFGAGFGIAFIAIWYLVFMLMLPGMLENRPSRTVFSPDRTERFPTGTPAQIDSPPAISPSRRFLGSTGIYDGEFSHDNSGTLASGPGRIVGSVTADSQPVPGLKLSLALNGRVMSQWATTDANGRYAIQVPFGEYRIDGYELDQASANTSLPGKIGHPLTPHTSGNFKVSKDSPGRGPDFRFVSPVTMNMPKNSFPAGEDVIIGWHPYPGASQYMVQIYEKNSPYGFTGNNRLFDWSHRPVVSETNINLAEYQVELKPGDFYTVEISAMDDNMNILSRTVNKYRKYDFEIAK